MEGAALEAGGRDALVALPELLIGALRLVDKLRMSLPLTTRLSLDLRKSLVSISIILSVLVDTFAGS